MTDKILDGSKAFIDPMTDKIVYLFGKFHAIYDPAMSASALIEEKDGNIGLMSALVFDEQFVRSPAHDRKVITPLSPVYKEIDGALKRKAHKPVYRVYDKKYDKPCKGGFVPTNGAGKVWPNIGYLKNAIHCKVPISNYKENFDPGFNGRNTASFVESFDIIEISENGERVLKPAEYLPGAHLQYLQRWIKEKK